MADAPEKTTNHPVYKLYRRRWFLLAVFFCFSGGNSFQWIQYSIISNLVSKYYDVSSLFVDFTSIVFMVAFIPFIFWASNLIDRKGMRIPMLLGTAMTALGAAIKLFSVSPDRFWVTFVGQTLVAVGQIFMLSVPPTLAAIWFGEKEVSTACAIGTVGNQMGIVLGFLVPPLVVHDHDNIDDIGTELNYVFIGSAAFNGVVFMLTLIWFEARPPTPPSPQKALQSEKADNVDQKGFMELVRFIVRLLCDRDFLFLFLAYGLNQAVVNAMGTLLNQVMEFYFGDASIAGYVGMTSVIGGIIGGLIFGKILDKTRRYKLVACTVYGLSAIGMTGFTFVLKTKSELLVYIVTAIFGFFLGGYMPVGFDFAIEITYPEPEAMTSGLLTLGLQVISTAATYIYGEGVRSWGVDEANYFLIGILVVGTILNFGMKPKLKRQEAATQKESAGQP